MAQTIVGRGVFGWHAKERRTDRYGAFSLNDEGFEGNGYYPTAGYFAPLTPLIGKTVKITARILEARPSNHVGDFFRGIFPITPEVGEVIDLGTGRLFTEEWDYALGVGLQPDDGRDSDWFDPRKLYRLHDQTVEITITEV